MKIGDIRSLKFLSTSGPFSSRNFGGKLRTFECWVKSRGNAVHFPQELLERQIDASTFGLSIFSKVIMEKGKNV